MRNTLLTKSTLALTLFLAVVAFAVGSFAYSEPIASWPTNTIEPIDTGMANQAKVGPLSVFAFFARGNADFKKDLRIDGVVQGGDPGETDTEVRIASNTLVTGDLWSLDKLQADSLKHNESAPKTVCGDENGIVVFCADVCDNIDGEQPAIPAGYEILSGKACTPIPDLCSNIDGLQQTLNQDLTIEDPSQPTFCTQTIRGTIWAGQHGNVSMNMAENAMLANLTVKNITINSIGGDTTRTEWPSSTPLQFRWSFCAKWNPIYFAQPNPGPTYFNSRGGGSINNAINSVSEGQCAQFNNEFPDLNLLNYGYKKFGTNGRYIAWDGTNNRSGDPKGFFDAEDYDLHRYRGTLRSVLEKASYGALDYMLKKNYTTPEYANIKLPLEKLFLHEVKVPEGYRLDLTTDPVRSPGTQVYLFESDYSTTVQVENTTQISGGVMIGAPSWNSGVFLTVKPGSSYDFPRGRTYNAYARCINGSDAAITPSTFSIPHDPGILVLRVSC